MSGFEGTGFRREIKPIAAIVSAVPIQIAAAGIGDGEVLHIRRRILADEAFEIQSIRIDRDGRSCFFGKIDMDQLG